MTAAGNRDAKAFSGSYLPSDVTFLLKRIAVQELSVDAKERYIQNGGGHYSEVLTPEKAPTPEYLQLFARQLSLRAPQVAQDVIRLATQIHERNPAGPLTLVSLARAGTPYGILLRRALRRLFDRVTTHYCVSIIRDRGLDLNALAYICGRHASESVVFVDGWTGKGVIGRELKASVQQFNEARGTRVSSDLHVLVDIAGTAAVSATREDYLLPSAVLNATVSGLISRTALNDQVGPEDFHGFMFLYDQEPWDQSRRFVDVVWGEVQSRWARRKAMAPAVPAHVDAADLAGFQQAIERYSAEYSASNANLVKPGVGEATRVLLRRKPLLLVVRDEADSHVEHLLHLAAQRDVRVLRDSQLPFRALALIDRPD